MSRFIDKDNIGTMMAIQFDKEQSMLNHVRPCVIDANSIYYDKWGDRHTDACGWLSIHAALHYDLERGKLPQHLVKMWNEGMLTTTELKLLSKCNYTEERILPEEIATICTKLGIEIHVYHLLPGVGMGVDYYPRSDEHIEGMYHIDLWLSEAHYCVYISPSDAANAKRFATKHKRCGYKYKVLNPLPSLAKDRKLAEKIQSEWNNESSKYK